MPIRRATVAIAGAGAAGAVQGLAAAAAGATVVAVASRTPERAAALAAELRARPCRYDELPAGAGVVVVASPPACHAPHALAALRAGAAVVVEKPLATTLAEADALVAAAGAGGRLLYAENLLFAPVVEAFLDRLPGLGPLTHLEARSLQARPGRGAFLSREWGGGALFDLGVHPLAVVLAAAAPARPVAVAAALAGGADHPTDEHAEVRVRFGTGLVATVVASWRAASTTWDVEAAGATGVLRADLQPVQALERDGAPVRVPGAGGPPVERAGYAGQLRRFLADLSAGRPAACSAGTGRDVLDVVCAAYASAGSSGQEVAVPFAGPRDRTPIELWRPG